jgi:hypothetical protein
MFVSVRQLKEEMGVDEAIARFFVDRNVPANNSFWQKRLLYIGRANGYISIPVYYDILYRVGVQRENLLEEQHVYFMEQLMHYAILHEKKEISFFQQLQKINEMLAGRIKSQAFYEELLNYLTQPVLLPRQRLGLDLPSMNRADVFLFVLCDLPLSEKSIDDAIRYWYALHPSYLIFDDVYDYEKDKTAGEENVILELGGGIEGLEKAISILEKNAEILKEISPALCDSIYLHIEEVRERESKFE